MLLRGEGGPASASAPASDAARARARSALEAYAKATPDAVNPWRAVTFFASPDAAKLAESLAA